MINLLRLEIRVYIIRLLLILGFIIHFSSTTTASFNQKISVNPFFNILDGIGMNTWSDVEYERHLFSMISGVVKYYGVGGITTGDWFDGEYIDKPKNAYSIFGFGISGRYYFLDTPLEGPYLGAGVNFMNYHYLEYKNEAIIVDEQAKFIYPRIEIGYFRKWMNYLSYGFEFSYGYSHTSSNHQVFDDQKGWLPSFSLYFGVYFNDFWKQ